MKKALFFIGFLALLAIVGSVNEAHASVSLSAKCEIIGIAEVGEPVVWKVTASGGIGSYTYSWSGTDGLSGSSSQIVKTYQTSGTKFASAKVVSGGSSATATCTVFIKDKPVSTPTLVGSCSGSPSQAETGETVTWTANVTGGTGSYTYSWSGTDGLSGSSKTVTKKYSDEGIKDAQVKITSGNQTITKNCSVKIDDREVSNPPLSASCQAVATGKTVFWKVSAVGGSGAYSYSWTGTDGLSSSVKEFSKTYSTFGTKSATVKVTSSGSSTSATCSVTLTDNTPDLGGSCVGSPSMVEEGETVTWTANPTGGTGSYSYSWSGTNGLSGNGKSVSKSYSSEGTKEASVTITSGNKSITRTCSILVKNEISTPPLGGSCSASPNSPEVGETVTWTANPTGGTGSYSYSWSGTNGLSGSGKSVSKTYSSDGLKEAKVKIKSGDQEIERTCDVFVDKEEDDDDFEDLEVSCTPDGEEFEVDERVTWRAHVDGGDGDYDYEWSGTDGLDGDDESVSIRYDDEGRKTARVEVESGDGQSASATCRIDIEEEDEDDDDDLEIQCRISDTRIEEGDRVEIEVEIDGGNSPFEIEWSGDTDDIDDFDDDARRQTVRIEDEGRYDLRVRVEDDDGNRDTDTCPVIRVEDDDDSITIDVDDDRPGQVAGVFLSQVPYTGFTDSPVLNLIIYIFGGITLAVIALVATFVIKSRRREVATSKFANKKNNSTYKYPEDPYTPDEITEALENAAFENKVIVSADVIEAIRLRSKGNKVKALLLLNKTIERLKAEGAEDWTTIRKEKLA